MFDEGFNDVLTKTSGAWTCQKAKIDKADASLTSCHQDHLVREVRKIFVCCE